jgi:hypothetical protein
MAQTESALFTVGVFADAAWAERGIDALKKQGFAAALVERVTGGAPESLELPGVGPALARGSLMDTLNGSARELTQVGLAAAMRRAGFQPHDGLIFERLVGKGGVLVAVQTAPRAADALAVMLSYGGGNAAIGAWGPRV